MQKQKRYCNICHKECEYIVLQAEDAVFEARESSHVVARGSSHVEARGSSHVEAWESSHVEAWESSHVEAWGSSHVVAWGSSHVEARGSSHVEATSPYVTITAKDSRTKIKGGMQIGTTIIPATQWLEKCGVTIDNGYAILFKSTEPDFTTRNGVSFKPGTTHKAPDWEANPTIDSNFDGECGKGIHYSPTVAQAKTFRGQNAYIACRVKVSDMADLPAFALYPDKIRAKGGKALYQVDENGDRIPTPAAEGEVHN